jgi:hypothetical protein
VNLIRAAVLAAGVATVLLTFASAVRTVVIPRGIPARLARFVFFNMRRLFRLRARPKLPYEKRDRVMALYAPVSLLVLLLVWLGLILAAYTGVYWGMGHTLPEAFSLSGSALLTLGFQRPADVATTALVFTEGALGLILLAMLITYLPSIYGVFSRRENTVAGLEVRAGSPPSGVELLQRSWRVDRLESLPDLWERWEQWFLDIAETHTSFPAVVFFRSPQPEHSWVTASGAVLDGAALLLSSVDRPADPPAAYCIRAGYLALRRVADFFGIPYEPDPKPSDPTSIIRDEFDEALEALGRQGLPLITDHDAAWRAFQGWRVNYDRVLVGLAGLTMSPFAPWSSDRSIRDWRPRDSLRRLRRDHAAFGEQGDAGQSRA